MLEMTSLGFYFIKNSEKNEKTIFGKNVNTL